MTPLIVVAGAGPAGLAAATAAARHGAMVILCEEGSEPGGQLRWRVQPVETGIDERAEKPRPLTMRLVADASAAGAELRTDTLVAGAFPGRELLLLERGQATRVVPDAFIVATGSSDLPYPFAGATLPGVFSARGLQILMNRHRVRPGRRFAVIGGGAEAEELAVDIMLTDGEIVWSGIAPAPFLRAAGANGVTALAVGSESYAVDIIAIAIGRQADAALAVMSGAPLAFSKALGGLVPILDKNLQSRVPRLYVAGDAAGPTSVAVALAEGRLAGVSVAAAFGLATDEAVSTARAAGGPELAWRIEKRGSLTPIPGTRMSEPDAHTTGARVDQGERITYICRCEEVTSEEIVAALVAGATSINGVKRRTRAGMGVCQGIYCQPVIAAMVAQATGTTVDQIAPMTARPPVRVVPLEVLAELAYPDAEAE